MCKFMNEVFKDMNKYIDKSLKGVKRFRLVSGLRDDEVGFLMDGHIIKWYFNCEVAVNMEHEYFTNDSILDASKLIPFDEGVEYKLTPIREVTSNGKTLVKFENVGGGADLWIVSDHMKYFDTKYTPFSDYEFRAVNGKSPLVLYNRGRVEGVILPVNHG